MKNWLDKQLDLFEPVSKYLNIGCFEGYFNGTTFTDGSEWVQERNTFEFERNGNMYEFVGSDF